MPNFTRKKVLKRRSSAALCDNTLSESPSPPVLLKERKDESCTGIEATKARHSPVASKDPACPNKSGNPSGFDSLSAQDISPDTEEVEEIFGKDTAAKSAAYASDEIYVENMWGELRKATPPPSEQALSYGITTRPVSQVDKKLKGIAERVLGKYPQKYPHTTYNIELQERSSRPLKS